VIDRCIDRERGQRLYPVQPRRIDYVESAGNYVKFHVDKCEYIARESMKRLEVILGRAGFVRIERTLLLNILAISFVETVGHGAFAFTLSNGCGCIRAGVSGDDLAGAAAAEAGLGVAEGREADCATEAKVRLSKVAQAEPTQSKASRRNLGKTSS